MKPLFINCPKLILILFLLVGPMISSVALASDRMVLIDPTKYIKDGVRLYPHLQKFYIDRYEVTVEEHFNFLKKNAFRNYKGYRQPKKKHFQKAAARVHWFEAQAYCHSLNKRLPTNEEWSAAAAGPGRIYPWGEMKLDGERANYCDVNCASPWADFEQNDGYEKIAPVGKYPKGQTPEGVFDLAGNLWEWTSTIQGKNEVLPYKGKDHTQDENYHFMIIRGGSYGSRIDQMTTDAVSRSPAYFRSSHVGFRCVGDYR